MSIHICIKTRLYFDSNLCELLLKMKKLDLEQAIIENVIHPQHPFNFVPRDAIKPSHDKKMFQRTHLEDNIIQTLPQLCQFHPQGEKALISVVQCQVNDETKIDIQFNIQSVEDLLISLDVLIKAEGHYDTPENYYAFVEGEKKIRGSLLFKKLEVSQLFNVLFRKYINQLRMEKGKKPLVDIYEFYSYATEEFRSEKTSFIVFLEDEIQNKMNQIEKLQHRIVELECELDKANRPKSIQKNFKNEYYQQVESNTHLKKQIESQNQFHQKYIKELDSCYKEIKKWKTKCEKLEKSRESISKSSTDQLLLQKEEIRFQKQKNLELVKEVGEYKKQLEMMQKKWHQKQQQVQQIRQQSSEEWDTMNRMINELTLQNELLSREYQKLQTFQRVFQINEQQYQSLYHYTQLFRDCIEKMKMEWKQLQIQKDQFQIEQEKNSNNIDTLELKQETSI